VVDAVAVLGEPDNKRKNRKKRGGLMLEIDVCAPVYTHVMLGLTLAAALREPARKGVG